MEENLASVKNKKDCERQVLDLLKELRDTKEELMDENIQIKIIDLREKLMEIPDNMYIDDE